MIGSRSLPVSNDGYADVVFRHRPLGVQSGRVMRRSGDTIAPDRPLVAAARQGLPTLALLSGGGRGPGARANGWLGCPFRCRLVTVEDAVECLADTRIELAACCSSDLFERCLLGHRLAVGAGGGHGAVGVAASDDAGGERDLPATQSVWVAAAVTALVCAATWACSPAAASRPSIRVPRRTSIDSLLSGCVCITARSSGPSALGARRTASGSCRLPSSWTLAAKASWRQKRPPWPSSAATAGASSSTQRQCSATEGTPQRRR